VTHLFYGVFNRYVINKTLKLWVSLFKIFAVDNSDQRGKVTEGRRKLDNTEFHNLSFNKYYLRFSRQWKCRSCSRLWRNVDLKVGR
jgi:hypothetical protein